MAVVEPAEQRDLNDTSALIDEAGGAGSLRPYSMGEVEQIVREMPRTKHEAAYWPTARKDLFNVVVHFADTVVMPVQWKSNFIALVPKCGV